ncbi:hypothetical protein ACE1CD_15370 [Aerosakkonema sp. BLCC-F183]
MMRLLSTHLNGRTDLKKTYQKAEVIWGKDLANGSILFLPDRS